MRCPLATATVLCVYLALPWSVHAATGSDPWCEWIPETSTLVNTNANVFDDPNRGSYQVYGAYDFGNADRECGAPSDPSAILNYEVQVTYRRANVGIEPYEEVHPHTAAGHDVKWTIRAPDGVTDPELAIVMSTRISPPGKTIPRITASATGLDLTGDRVDDIEIVGYRTWNLTYINWKRSGVINLRRMPHDPRQRLYVRLAGAAPTTIVGPATGGETTILTGPGNDRVYTYATNDIIDVSRGNDVVRSGAGDDAVGAGAGHDRIWTGPGNDRAELDGSHYGRVARDEAGRDVAVLGPGTNFARSWGGFDRVIGNSGRDLVSVRQARGVYRLGGGSDQFEVEDRLARGRVLDCGSGRGDFVVYMSPKGRPPAAQMRRCEHPRLSWLGGIPWIFPWNIGAGIDGSYRKFRCGERAMICRNRSRYIVHNP